ncbi:hypothetical protein, partial [Bacillus sp. SRB_331]|uniref:hypothetical protein n=1 Tax=Bacillus sp. SRB_331 TaxID=1969379 RepID=UPI001C6575F4
MEQKGYLFYCSSTNKITATRFTDAVFDENSFTRETLDQIDDNTIQLHLGDIFSDNPPQVP